MLSWFRKWFPETKEQRAERLLADKTPYPTLTELGLAVGDDVVWDNPDHTEYVGRDVEFVRRVVRGRIVRDESEMKPTRSGERFVSLDSGYSVSTKYLRKAP